MKSITLRPLFTGCAVFLLFSCLMYDVSLQIKLLIAAAGSFTACFAFLFLRRRKRALRLSLAVSLLLAAASAVSSLAFNVRLVRASERNGEAVEVTAVIEEVVYSGDEYGIYTAALSLQDGERIRASLELNDGSCRPGDVLVGQVTLRALRSDGVYNELAMNLPEGIMISAESESMSYTGSHELLSLKYTLGGLGRKLSSVMASRTAGGVSLVRAVLLGDRSGLEGTLERDFSRIGVSHTIAISGMHLSVIAVLLERLLEKTKLKRVGKSTVLCSVIFVFMGLTGFTSSILRAGTMHIFRTAGTLAGRKGDSYTSLGVAATLIVLISPFSVLDAGFLLSVISAYACIAYAESSKKRKKSSHRRSAAANALIKAARYIADTVLVTLLITAMTLPVMWKYFGEVSILSPLTNLIFIPLTTLLLYCGIILLLLCPFGSAAYCVSIPVAAVESFAAYIAYKLSSLRSAVYSLSFPGCAGLIVILSVLILAFPLLRGKAKRLSAFFALLTSVCLVLTVRVGVIGAYSSEELLYAPNGKNDIIMLRRGLSCAVADITNGNRSDLQSIIENVKKAGCTEIESVVLTHLHRRHISSVESLIENIMVREVVLPEPIGDDELSVCGDLYERMKELGVKVRFYEREDGSCFTASNISFSAFDSTYLSRSTHPIVGIGFEICGESIVYASGSANEGSDGLRNAIFTADTVIFGGHPPVYKSDLTLPAGGERLISPSALWSGFDSSPTGGDTLILRDGEVYRIKADKYGRH